MEFGVTFSLYLTTLILFAIGFVQCYELQDVLDLKEFLFNKSDYDTNVRPIMNQSDTLKVNVGFSFSTMSNLTITTGTMKMSSLIAMSWKDEQLQWNSTRFGGIGRLNLDSDKLWTPALTQLTDIGYEFPVSPSWIYSNGNVVLMQAGEITGNCHIDMTYFPYDVHDCYIDFVSVFHPSEELRLASITDRVNLEMYVANGQWDILATKSYVTSIMDQASGVITDYYTNKVKIRRKPEFLLIHVAMPMALILILNAFVYIVPLDSGERISISVTLLLAMVFFTTDLSNRIPESSENISLLSMIMVAVNSSSTLSVAASVVLCRIVTRSNTSIASPLEWITRLYLRCPKVSPLKDPNVVENISIVYDIHGKCASGDMGYAEDKAITAEKRKVTWAEVAKCIDSILFTITLVFVIVVCVGFSGVMIHVCLKSFEYDP